MTILLIIGGFFLVMLILLVGVLLEAHYHGKLTDKDYDEAEMDYHIRAMERKNRGTSK